MLEAAPNLSPTCQKASLRTLGGTFAFGGLAVNEKPGREGRADRKHIPKEAIRSANGIRPAVDVTRPTYARKTTGDLE